ncbi:MAG: tyrosine-type recombinase/integrase [Burkholderiaceae bacterium]|nr:tyrosine-type recombinase/integrase [Burkholderiaceae bacterium]
MQESYGSARAIVRAAQGPLSAHLEAYVSSLIEQQYSAHVVCMKARSARGFSVWLARQRIEARDADEHAVALYRRERARARRVWSGESHALGQLLIFLRERGVIAAPTTVAEIAPADRVVLRFKEHLLHVRGLAAHTISMYAAWVRRFLTEQVSSDESDLKTLRAADVITFVRHQARSCQPGELKRMTTALRSFLRYAQLQGEVASGIVAAVPAVASWTSTPALPRAISAEHARRALDACDQHTAIGRRDYAVLLLLARLGLRAGEVVALLLDDVDWDAGRVRVRGKAGREAWLPLPTDVGEAITAYLQHDRPNAPDRHLFLRASAPIRGLSSGMAVASIVAHALRRAGIDTPRRGAHQFRHALATQMLRRGASLTEIGELLRHRSPQTTAIYARVDLAALRALALPWPGGAR